MSVQLLTNSRVKTFRGCQRQHQLRYVRFLEPVRKSSELIFGTAYHAMLEFWYRAMMTWNVWHEAAGAAVAYMRGLSGHMDPFDRVRCEELFLAYAACYAEQGFEVLAVEVEFVTDLINPDTGYPSRLYRLGGKIDAIVRRRGRVYVMEHKTSAEDLSVGSSYWQRLKLDSQISTYYEGATALGYEVAGVIYDVSAKPGQRQQKATPHELRKYTRATAKEPSRLYAAQREFDETIDEYRQRVRGVIAADPASYFARAEIVRLEDERTDHASDTWELTQQIMASARTGRAPKNPDACHLYGRDCSYLPICTREGSADDPALYQIRTTQNPELEAK